MDLRSRRTATVALRIFAFATVVLSATSWSDERSFPQLKAVSPTFRGTWLVHAVSYDQGNTLERSDPPRKLADVTKRRIVMYGNAGEVTGTAVVTKVLDASTSNKGLPRNVLALDGGRVWAVSRMKGDELVLVEVIDAANSRETVRFIVTVVE